MFLSLEKSMFLSLSRIVSSKFFSSFSCISSLLIFRLFEIYSDCGDTLETLSLMSLFVGDSALLSSASRISFYSSFID